MPVYLTEFDISSPAIARSRPRPVRATSSRGSTSRSRTARQEPAAVPAGVASRGSESAFFNTALISQRGLDTPSTTRSALVTKEPRQGQASSRGDPAAPGTGRAHLQRRGPAGPASAAAAGTSLLHHGRRAARTAEPPCARPSMAAPTWFSCAASEPATTTSCAPPRSFARFATSTTRLLGQRPTGPGGRGQRGRRARRPDGCPGRRGSRAGGAGDADRPLDALRHSSTPPSTRRPTSSAGRCSPRRPRSAGRPPGSTTCVARARLTAPGSRSAGSTSITSATWSPRVPRGSPSCVPSGTRIRARPPQPCAPRSRRGEVARKASRKRRALGDPEHARGPRQGDGEARRRRRAATPARARRTTQPAPGCSRWLGERRRR